MANYKPSFGKIGILERLKNSIMPPAYSTQQPTKEEREDMIKVLTELKK